MEYIPVLILMVVGLAVGVGALGISALLSPRVPNNRRKNEPFECGVPPIGDAKHRFSVRFYLVAILFLLFDVEAIFFFPWAVAYKHYLTFGSFILVEMGGFVGVLLIGYFYVLKRGALEWE